jgi:hypothetical protein
MSPGARLQTKGGDGMKRLHLHVLVESLPDAIRFYSSLFDTPPCCGGASHASWRVEEPPVNLAVSLANRPAGIAHFGLEVESPADLPAIDRVLHRALLPSGTVPWEVSVRKQPVRKEKRS